MVGWFLIFIKLALIKLKKKKKKVLLGVLLGSIHVFKSLKVENVIMKADEIRQKWEDKIQKP